MEHPDTGKIEPLCVRLNQTCIRMEYTSTLGRRGVAPERRSEAGTGDICRLRATLIDKLSDEQIQALLDDNAPSLPSERLLVNVVSLYRAKGRTGLMAKFDTELARFEQTAKVAGAKEIPSGLDKHTEWWFQHYVLHLRYPQISKLIAQATSGVGPYPENVQKAVTRLSQLLEIEPAEPP